VDRLVGLDGVRSDIAMMRVPANTPGMHRIMFAVDDIDDVIDRLRPPGAELVRELVRYENSYRLCYLRGPAGILVALAERIT
jgi:catechol 2,3-dioxygenase-like lactoylglutathione lyase family enzyme